MDDVDCQTVNMPINGHEWPIPTPSDTTLERGVRIELLNYASRHDVVRLEEWKFDAPTIGAIYPDSYRNVYYYSGRDRLEVCDFNSPRHWQKQAWTLQETNPRSVYARVCPLSTHRTCPSNDVMRPCLRGILACCGQPIRSIRCNAPPTNHTRAR